MARPTATSRSQSEFPSGPLCDSSDRFLNVVNLADPRDPRVPLLEEGFRAAGLPIPTTISYADIFSNPAETLSTLPCNSVLRIDSPGRSADINNFIFEAGHKAATLEGSPTVTFDSSAWSAGAFLAPRQWYLGFAAILANINSVVSARAIRLVPAVDDILLAFDKQVCHSSMKAAGLPVPSSIIPPPCADDLFEQLRSTGMPRIFIKSRHGSGAAGIIALQHSHRGTRAWTTIERCGCQLYNSRRITVLDSLRDITQLIDSLYPHHVHIERWIPKATIDGSPTDLRILAIGGEPTHIVLRRGKGSTPMTNLHLGGTRGSPEVLREHIHPEAWDAMLNDVRRAAALFPQSFQISFDIAFDSAFRKHTLLEANVFGDLLKGVLHNGMSTYEIQARKLQSWLEPQSRGAPL